MKQRTDEQWIAELSGGRCEEEALEDLRMILQRGLRAAIAGRVRGDFNAIVEDFTQEALVKILKSLDSFRGESRFTTWAQKIAVHEAFTELGRRQWQDVSLQGTLEQRGEANAGPEMIASSPSTPEQQTTQQAALLAVQRLIEEELTERQRQVMVSVMEGMPLQEVARRMGANRSAVYKTLHDARKRLKKRLEEEGSSPQEVLAVFVDY